MMPVRLKRIVASFLVVLAAFWAYRLMAEPFLEPEFEEKRVVRSSGEARERARVQLENRLGDYLRFFPEGAWERNNPIVVESKNAKLLLREYTNQPDGTVTLTPCTVIYLPNGEADESNPQRRVVILQAPEGAKLQFDDAVDLNSGNVGRLRGGELRGPITIHSGPTRPEGGDDLLITTRDARLQDNQIFTPHEVQFRFGASYGRGEGLRIALLPSAEPVGSGPALNVGGIQDVELLKAVQMHLQPASSGLLPGSGRRPQSNGTSTAGTSAQRDSRSRTPVDVDCHGPFKFDVVHFIATFYENVRVLQSHPNGPTDTMTCEELSIFFAERLDSLTRSQSGRDENIASPASNLPRLEPRRLEARGNPVIVNAPSSQLEARGDRLMYDVATQAIELEGYANQQGDFQEVMFKQATNEARARSLLYEPGPDGRWLGKFYSVGPGWLDTAPSEQNVAERFKARWKRELKMRPHEGSHVISLVGDALASYTSQGELQADEIHLWLIEVPPNKSATRADNSARSRIRPIQLLAEGPGGVRIESPQLSGAVGRLEAFFRQLAEGTEPQRRETSPMRSGRPRPESRPESNGMVASSARTTDGHPRPSNRPRQHYEVSGQTLKLGVVSRGEQAEVEDVSLIGNVRFAESVAASNGEQPLDIRGEQIEVRRANVPQSEVTVVGTPSQPAHVASGGMTMSGPKIQLDLGQNQLWVDGAGRMTLNQPQNAARPNATAGGNSSALWSTGRAMALDWQGNMQFDGLTARFQHDVVAQQSVPRGTQTLRTELMDVTMRQRINFSANQNQPRPDVELVHCHGESTIENREFAGRDPMAIELIHVEELTVNQRTGELTSRGAGHLESWRHSSATNSLQTGTIPARPATATANSQDQNRINHLDIHFQRGITGNILRREFTFFDQVQCLHGPVETWNTKINADGPGRLPAGTQRMTCDSLKVYEIETLPNQEGAIAMEATGNTVVEGQSEQGEAYTARAHKLKYDDSKQLIVLEGDDHGRTDVQLFRQSKPTDPWSPFVARSVMYSRRTGWASTQGFKQLDLSQFGARPNAAAAPPSPTGLPNAGSNGGIPSTSRTPASSAEPDDPFDVPGFRK